MRGGLGMKQGSGAGIEVEYEGWVRDETGKWSWNRGGVLYYGGGGWGLQFTVPDVIIHFALAN